MASSLHLFVTVTVLSLQGMSVLGELNVYSEDMQHCGPNHAGGCTYTSYDAGAHQVCVRKLPHGFSSDTGQGPWSDDYQGQPWCICIWAYSNYILQKKDLKLKCNSIPSKVLEEQYSLDKFKQCGSMSSTEGCGAEDIRRSIQSLCNQCNHQATSLKQKNALKTRCDAILASAPKAAMQRLDDESSAAKAAMEQLQTASPASPFLFAVLAMGMVLGLAALKMWNTRQQQSEPSMMDAGDPEVLMVAE